MLHIQFTWLHWFYARIGFKINTISTCFNRVITTQLLLLVRIIVAATTAVAREGYVVRELGRIAESRC